MLRRIATLGLMLAAMMLAGGAAHPAYAASRNDTMRQNILMIRGLVDRVGAANFFVFPLPARVVRGRLGTARWPADPWTGAPLTPGHGRGHYAYQVSSHRRSYRLTGYLDSGTFVVGGSMPRQLKLAYDHRGEEGLNLIRQYVERWAGSHDGLYPDIPAVTPEGAVNQQAGCSYWPSNPWDHRMMAPGDDHGSFRYEVSADRASYTLKLHRALKTDYVLTGSRGSSEWYQVLAGLDDEILKRNGSILAGFVRQWCLQHVGLLPSVDELSPAGAVGTAHADWPLDPVGGKAMEAGSTAGTYTYEPGASGAFVLTVHLRNGDYQAGGTAPSPVAASLLAALFLQ